MAPGDGMTSNGAGKARGPTSPQASSSQYLIMSLAKIEAGCSSPKEAQLNLKGTCTPYKKEKKLQELGKGIISGKTCIWKYCSYCAKDIY